eukprot:2403938-Amphidinium_carterae.1
MLSGSPSSGYRIFHRDNATLADVRKCIGRRLHVRQDRLVFTVGRTNEEGLDRHEVEVGDSEELEQLGTLYLAVKPNDPSPHRSRRAVKRPASGIQYPRKRDHSSRVVRLSIPHEDQTAAVTTTRITGRGPTYLITHHPNATADQVAQVIHRSANHPRHVQLFVPQEAGARRVFLHGDIAIGHIGGLQYDQEDTSQPPRRDTESVARDAEGRPRNSEHMGRQLHQMIEERVSAATALLAQIPVLIQEFDVLEGAGAGSEHEY